MSAQGSDLPNQAGMSETDIPDMDEAHLQQCVEFVREILDLTVHDGGITELHEQKARLLGFPSLDAALRFGINLSRTNLQAPAAQSD